MRLDKYLKVSRLIKRRSVAKDVSDKERILVNGNPAKPAKQLNVGDVITVLYSQKSLSVKILEIPEGNVLAKEADKLYQILED